MQSMSIKTPKKIYLAHTKGFCAGVSTALKTVELALEKYGTPLYVRHHIVHNTAVIKQLETRGVVFIEELKDVPDNNNVIFSAHGVAPKVYEEGKQRGLHIIDATCPLVKKVHGEAIRFSKKEIQTILIGHQGHQELIGTSGYVKSHLLFIVEDEADVEKLKSKIDSNKPIAIITQTTLSVSDTKDIISKIKETFPSVQVPKKEDICFATQNRQDAVLELTKTCDVIIVVGSSHSSNSNRLKETAEKQGIPSYLIDFPEQINFDWLKNKESIGISSGASVPDFLVDKLVKNIVEIYPEITLFQEPSIEKDIEFAIPKI